MLIGCRKYDFTDQSSGEQIQGGKLFIGIDSDDVNTSGLSVSEIPYDFGHHAKMSALCKQHKTKQVSVSCDIQLVGRRTKLKATEIEVV